MSGGPRPADVRPRYGRLAAFAGAVTVTTTAVLGGAGVLPTGVPPSYAQAAEPVASLAGQPLRTGATAPRRPAPIDPLPLDPAPVDETATPVPEGSGHGRRVVFDMSDQRVWLVGRDGSVRRSYLVSGSLHDNLQPGVYEVYSRSRDAVGVDGSTMEYMVRFTHGENAAIGFHDIPVMRGRLVQTTAELGTPQSHGCIRQAEADARAMWRFGRVGTGVVVTA